MPPHADVLQWEHLPFPKSLRDFQRLFPSDEACARYLEGAKWPRGFVCPHCEEKGEPVRLATRPGVLACRTCRKQTSLTVGTVMQRTHTPLTVWFWAAYLVSSMTPGLSAVQFQRQLALSRYETAFQILHKLRAGMVRPGRDRIGGNLGRGDHVEIDETYIGGVTVGEGKGVHADEKTLVAAAVEVRTRPAKKGDKPVRRGGRYAGRLRLEIVADRTAKSLCGFVEQAVEPGAMVITDAWGSYNSLGKRGYAHLPVVEANDSAVAEEYLPIVHLVFSNLKAWLQGTHHGRVEPQHLQAYLNEFTFRFNRRFYPFNAFRSLLGIGTNGEGPTYDGIYQGTWKHPTMESHQFQDFFSHQETKMRHLIRLFWSLRYAIYNRDLYRGLREGRGSKENPLLMSDLEPTMKMLNRLAPAPEVADEKRSPLNQKIPRNPKAAG